MQLTRQQQGLLDGDGGPACQWAMQFNHDLGNFFGAEQMVPVASAHFAPDTGMAGDPGKKLLAFLESHQARVVVPAYLDPCSVDIGRAAEWMATYGVSETFIAADRETQRHCRALGFRPTYTCINYQTIEAPKRGDHLAWGDTGAAIAANAMFGARTNFEGGPSALASALIGCTPAYGMHLPGNRRGNLSVRITCAPEEIADWGALAAIAGTLSVGYDTVLVFHGDFAPPSFDMLKQFAVALASYGGHAMFHLAGVTPEAATLEAAFGGTVPGEEHVVTRQDLDAVFERSTMADNSVDLVVFAAPQLSIDEVAEIVERLDGRRVHGDTKLILAIDPQVRSLADKAGLTERLAALGGEFSTGTCFYPEAPVLRETTGWRNLVTNSAKLVNTLASAGYDVAWRRLGVCLDAAVTGRLES